MCGIIGIVGKLPDREFFEYARDTMFHRGPDDGGVYYSSSENVALGQRRLSIIDLSPAGHQPFVSKDGRYIMIFNGEIYNYKEIKEELKDFYQFSTVTDTEVLLASYIKWKEKCLDKLRGMFAFAVWDKEEKSLFIARDRLGIKPLYFYQSDNGFIFASEIKAILATANIPRKLNKQSFLDYLSYRYPLGNQTMFENIFSLLPGYYMTLKQTGEAVYHKYWDLPIVVNKQDPGEDEVIKKVENILKQSISYRMISDVPVGAYLSGGLDSSLLVALMSQMSNKTVKTFSIGFKEDGFDESVYARKVSEMYKTDHHELFMNADDYVSLIPEVIRYKDSPVSIPNEIALHVLSKELKKDISVVLSGEGADELFGGYGKIFRSGYDFERLKYLDENLSGDEKKELAFNLHKKYGDTNFGSIVEHFLGQYTYFNFAEKKNLLNPDIFGTDDKKISHSDYFTDYFSRLSDLTPTEQYMYIFQKVHLLGPLMRLDTATMSSAVEARVPFVDHKLVEYVSALPLKYKMAWKSDQDKSAGKVLNSDQISEQYDSTKYLLRKIARKYLPEEIVNRKKLGFPVPLNNWFSGKFNSYAKEILLSPQSRSIGLYNKKKLEDWLNASSDPTANRRGYNIWMLINVELWMKEYNVSI